MIIRYTDEFVRHYRHADVRIRKAFKTQLQVFEQDPTDSRLRKHALRGTYAGCHSIYVTADWRAIVRWSEHPNLDPVVYFLALGTHKQLYRKAG